MKYMHMLAKHDKMGEMTVNREQLMPALQCKVDELKLLGYEQATVEDVWNCLMMKKWKKNNEEKRLFELVNDVLSLRATDYMAYIMTKEQKHDRWFTEEGLSELEQLF
ncbi:post-transcriptional regulator [Anoxybacillus sp. ST4]|nr:post-transcriptional regulator [Anoxybacillus sp. ST4]